MRIVAQHAHQARIGAFVEPQDWRQLAAGEQRLQHHMIPSVLVELFHRERIAVSNRLEDRLHRAAGALARPGNVLPGVGIQRQSAIEGNQFPDVCGVEKRFQPRLECLAVASLACQHKGDAGGLIDAPIRRVPVRARGSSGSPLLGFEREITFAKLARGVAEGEIDILFAWRRFEPLDLGSEPVGCRSG